MEFCESQVLRSRNGSQNSCSNTHTTTGVSPAELLMGRRLRSRLDLLYPDVSRRVEKQQDRQKQTHDNTLPLRSFAEGDCVYAEDFTSSPCKWNAGTIVEVSGPLSYVVSLENGAVVRRHIDNIRRRPVQPALDSPGEVWNEPHVDLERVDGVNQDTLVPPVPVVPESVDPVPTASGEMATATPEVSVTPGTTADTPPKWTASLLQDRPSLAVCCSVSLHLKGTWETQNHQKFCMTV